MSSNSLRISADLFSLARDEAVILSRSTAQQVEYWARIGMAVEAAGLTVAAARDMVRQTGKVQLEHVASERELWAYKRRNQATDIANVRAGRVASSGMSWFTQAQARGATLRNSPY